MLTHKLIDRLLAHGPIRRRRPNRLCGIVNQVQARLLTLKSSSDAELRRRIADLRSPARCRAHAPQEQALPDLLSLAAEGLRRTLGIELYAVQLLAGAALCRGCVAEMQTGEGKTFTILLPACWYALSGEGVHVVTSNAYLAERDMELLRPTYECLGLTVALLPEQGSVEAKRTAYACDITYGTGYEFGFDYLRDQLAGGRTRNEPVGATYLRKLRTSYSESQTMQRGLAHAIVDEVDNVLLDDACSPLVIAQATSNTAPDAEAHRLARELSGELQAEADYRDEPGSGQLSLTPTGIERIHSDNIPLPLSVLERPWTEYVRQALQARHRLRRDVHYVVHDDEVRIIDGSTGRIFEDRTWQDGLHQAIEAKEILPIRAERHPLAAITRQRFFRQYRHLCGLTGTARGAEGEFQSVYGLPVEAIPLHRPSQLNMLPPRCFATSQAIWNAVTARAAELRSKGRPILIGTPSIVASDTLSEQLRRLGVEHHILNGRQDAAEADIVAQAGQPGRVTVATNLAGRGTDIKLPAETVAAGGLHVIACGRHRARRIDRQLIGRCARQGSPGSAEILVSAEDALLAELAPWIADRFTRRAAANGLVAEDWTATIDRLQRRAERIDSGLRLRLLQQDIRRESVVTALESPAYWSLTNS